MDQSVLSTNGRRVYKALACFCLLDKMLLFHGDSRNRIEFEVPPILNSDPIAFAVIGELDSSSFGKRKNLEEPLQDGLPELRTEEATVEKRRKNRGESLELVERSEKGTSEVLFLGESGEKKVVFKPASSESEERIVRHERAAFVLDRGFSGVPHTTLTLVELEGVGERFGSCQSYIEGEDAENYGANLFATDDVHRIGVLDVRILNRDRHSGNIIIRDSALVPIDHALAFPDPLEGELEAVSSELFRYPQAKEPFSEDVAIAIEAINLEDDLKLLKEEGLTENELLGVWMGTTVLKLAAKKGTTLHEIGMIVERVGDRSEPSVLEKLFEASWNSESSFDKGTFVKQLEEFLTSDDKTFK